jgi:hypothetical protein
MKHPQGKNNILSSAIKSLIIPLVDTLFFDVERYLFLLKQVMHIGANNSPLLLFLSKVEWPDRLLFTLYRLLVRIHILILNRWLTKNVWWIHVGRYLFLGHVCLWWCL